MSTKEAITKGLKELANKGKGKITIQAVMNYGGYTRGEAREILDGLPFEPIRNGRGKAYIIELVAERIAELQHVR